jgi:hypothetical protein
MALVIKDLSHPERLIRKPQVGGSIPLAGSRKSTDYNVMLLVEVAHSPNSRYA